MTVDQLHALAQRAAAANPDAAEQLAPLLAREARIVKSGGVSCGIVLHLNGMTGGLELRSGDILGGYVLGDDEASYGEMRL